MAFNLQIGLGAIICAVVAKKYVWPKLKMMPIAAALMPLMLIGAARYLGGTFLVSQLNGDLPAQFVSSAGWGDTIASLIALVAVFALMYSQGFGKLMAWVYAIVGGLDFLYAVYLATVLNIYSQVHVSWLIMVIVGPIQLINLIVLWCLLLKKPSQGMPNQGMM